MEGRRNRVNAPEQRTAEHQKVLHFEKNLVATRWQSGKGEKELSSSPAREH